MMEEYETLSAGQILEKPKNNSEATRVEFTLPDPRCKRCDYWRVISNYGVSRKACHYALIEGKLREKISKTECGSFLDKADAPKRKLNFACVPMSQWGCGGLNNRR